MATRPPLHALSPRSAAAATLAFPPSVVPSPVRPQSARPSSPSPSASPFPPRRPQSASRVRTTPTIATNAAVRSRAYVGVGLASSTVVSPRGRPASASRVRATATTSTTYSTSLMDRRRQFATTDGLLDDGDDDVDTIAIPTASIQITPPEQNHSEPHAEESRVQSIEPNSPLQRDDTTPLDRAAIAQAEQFLLSWQCEEATFRSPLLYAESSFAQAKAMTARDWPHPNVFLSSVAFGALELFSQSLERHHPFLPELLDAVGMALFTNHTELRRKATTVTTSSTSKFLHYMQHGQFCFQQLHAHEEQLHVWRSAAQMAKKEVAKLTEKIQKQHVARLFDRVQSRVKAAAVAADGAMNGADSKGRDVGAYPQLRRVLYGDQRGAHLDLEANDYEFEPSCDEVLLFFSSLPMNECLRLLTMLQIKAAEMQVQGMGEQYATAVDLLTEKERRAFLSHYFQLVSSEELKEALQERDESNQEKQWQAFLDEMKDLLDIDEFSARDEVVAQSKLRSFHSDEARVGAKVYDMVDLLEEIAAEVSLSDSKKPMQLSEELVARLKPFHSAKKKMEKARQLMVAKPESVKPPAEPTSCGCVCGQHRLVTIDSSHGIEDVPSNRSSSEVQEAVAKVDDEQVDADKTKKKRPSSAQSRLSSARSAIKRKSSAVARVNSRGSLPSVRLFPLAETCHLVSSVVQLQFSREALDGPTARRGSTRRNSQTSVSPNDQRPSFKALAKDLLIRKYGIKSIAVMHLLQLEKSLVHFGATEKHARCELFAWFIGADKTRSFSKDFAYQFYVRLIKSVMAIVLKKGVITLTYADQIAVWTEQIGEADTSAVAEAVTPKSLSVWQCVEVCNLAYPPWIKQSSAYTTFVGGINSATGMVELERFIKRAMHAWETQFVKLHAQVQETFTQATAPEPVDELDMTLFSKCIRASGLEMTSGEMLETFDLLSSDEDAYVSLKKAMQFVIDRKFLQPGVTT